MSLNIAVIYGSVRENRQGIKAAKFLVNKLLERNHNAVLIDPAEYKLPFLGKTYKEYKNDEAPAELKTLSGHLKNADAYIVVTAEYNHNMPPVLTNLMSYFGKEYERKVAGIVSYSNGPFGGVRAAIVAREFLATLGIAVVPAVFPISSVQTSFDDDGNVLDEKYDKRSEKFLSDFEWYASTLKTGREN